MAVIISGIHKRYQTTYWSMGGARWAFFALFIVFIILILLYTLRLNKQRARLGKSPVRGTAWITPPSYFQSQQQYNQPRHDNYVPMYTEHANDLDAGFYDNHGVFHPNSNYQPGDNLPPKRPIVSDEFTGTTNIGAPDMAHIHHDDPHDVELDDLYRRPMGPPPTNTNPFPNSTGGTLGTNQVSVSTGNIDPFRETVDTGSSSNTHPNVTGELPDYAPPSNPPPSHTKI